jgi:hypothetical protein
MMTAVERVEAAIACLRPGRPEDGCATRAMMWCGKLAAANKHLCKALREANRLGQNDMKRRIMRMMNWVRTEFYRTRKVLACR